MSELEDIWKKLSTEKLEASKTALTVQWPPHSRHPVRKLLNSFRLGLVFCIVFEILWIYFLITFRQVEVRIFVGLVAMGYLIFFFLHLRTYRDVLHETDLSGNLLQTFRNIYETTTRSLSFQRKVWLFVYPVAGAAGFLLGFATNRDPGLVFQETKLLTIMILVSLALTPIAYFLAQWLDQKAYGKYCDQLKVIIGNMEQSEAQISK